MSIHDLKVEAAFGYTLLDTTPVFTDVSAYFRPGGHTDRGRSSLEGRFSTGRGQLRFDNRDGRFTPENASGAYYPNVKIGVPIRVTIPVGGPSVPIFYGAARSWKPSYAADDAEVVVPLADGFYSLNLEDLAGQSYAAQKTNVRLKSVLNDIGWSDLQLDFDEGVANVQAKTFASPATGGDWSALGHMYDVAEAEVGTLFMSRSGLVTFRNRVAQSGASPSFTLDDDNIHRLVLTFDDDYFFNDIRISREDGAQIQVVNTTSIAAHGRRVLTRDVMPNANDSETLNAAEWLAEIFADPRLRIESLVVKLTDRQPHYADVLGAELRDYINVTHVSDFGVTINQDCSIEGIRHEWVKGGNWTCTLRVAPLSTIETQDYWIIGTSQLGTDTRVA